MKKIQDKLRETACDLLTRGEVEMVIGYARGSEASRVTPAFITNPGDAAQLVWNPLCVNSLVKYLLDHTQSSGKVAIVVKGCDSRAIIRLLQDNQIQREQVVVLGVPCPGMLEPNEVAQHIDVNDSVLEAEIVDNRCTMKTVNGVTAFNYEDSLLQKCCYCENPNPVIADYLLGQAIKNRVASGNPYEEINEIEALSTEEKSAYWDKQFSRCLRCYACRNVCPACSCRKCVFDQTAPNWVAKSNNLSENMAFHLIRAFHVAGRCVDCGECDRVCPANIPLRILNRKINKDINDLYNTPTPGSDITIMPVLGGFSTADPDEFM